MIAETHLATTLSLKKKISEMLLRVTVEIIFQQRIVKISMPEQPQKEHHPETSCSYKY